MSDQWEIFSNGAWMPIPTGLNSQLNLASQNHSSVVVFESESYRINFEEGILTDLRRLSCSYNIRLATTSPISAVSSILGPTSHVKSFSAPDSSNSSHQSPNNGKSSLFPASSAIYGHNPVSNSSYASSSNFMQPSTSMPGYSGQSHEPFHLPSSSRAEPLPYHQQPVNGSLYQQQPAALVSKIKHPPNFKPSTSSSPPQFGKLLFSEWSLYHTNKSNGHDTIDQLLTEIVPLGIDSINDIMASFSRCCKAPYASENGKRNHFSLSSSAILRARSNDPLVPAFVKQTFTTTLENTSGYQMAWKFTEEGRLGVQEFFAIEPPSGTLEPGQSAKITVIVVMLSPSKANFRRLCVIQCQYSIIQSQHQQQQQQQQSLETIFVGFLVHTACRSSSAQESYWNIDPKSLVKPEELSKGSHSTVYRAKLHGLYVAKKVFHQKNETHFKTELEVLSRVRHWYIIKMIGAYKTATEMCIVLEYCTGGTLFDYYRPDKTSGLSRDLNFKWAISFSLKLTEAVLALHNANILHRDLKSYNVMLTAHGEPRIIDFDVASIGIPSQQTAKPIGSLAWIAPEAYNDCINTEKSDIFSLGLVFLEITTRQVPQRSFFHVTSGLIPDVPQHLVDYSPNFAALIYHFCCHPDAEVRPTAAVLKEILKDLKNSPI
jgi:tRNA A-37 threonylcarbamoyl transferase component Bud32